MKVAVIGAGAIGGLVAGYLKDKGQEITLVGHADAVKAIRAQGLRISGVRGNFQIKLAASELLTEQPDLAILTTKTQDLEDAIRDNHTFLKDSLILTTQNGLKADEIAAGLLSKEKIISSIVMFGATYLEPGEIVHNFEGTWILGSFFPESAPYIGKVEAVVKNAFKTVITAEILGMKYLKVFVNANNCMPAILGRSMQETFADVEVSKISIAIWKEGLEIVQRSGISLVSLPDFPLERLMKLTALPTPKAAEIFSGIMANLSKEPLYGSILQSIQRKRTSEVDYINGEFVNLAKRNNLAAPLNEKLVEMVHQVEKTGSFFTQEELLRQTKGLVD